MSSLGGIHPSNPCLQYKSHHPSPSHPFMVQGDKQASCGYSHLWLRQLLPRTNRPPEVPFPLQWPQRVSEVISSDTSSEEVCVRSGRSHPFNPLGSPAGTHSTTWVARVLGPRAQTPNHRCPASRRIFPSNSSNTGAVTQAGH